MKGRLKKHPHSGGRDSSIRPYQVPGGQSAGHDAVRTRKARVVRVHEEGVESPETYVTVEFVDGTELGPVPWPGPSVETSPAGVAGGVVTGIHGLHAGPAPGAQVLLSFVNGAFSSPIVVNTYPYLNSKNPLLKAFHNLPLTKQGHKSKDIVLGHYTGAYVALRATSPIPAEVDIYSPSKIIAEAEVGFEFKSGVGNSVELSPAGFKVQFATGSKLEFLPTGSFTIEDPTGNSLEFGLGEFLMKFATGAELAMTVAGMLEYKAVGSNKVQFSPTGIISDGPILTWNAAALPTSGLTHMHGGVFPGPALTTSTIPGT